MKIASPLARSGEEIAANYLKGLGYKIIDRNFRARNTELDIVAVYKNILIFVEVKTRTSNKFGTPLEQITYWKLKSLTKAAQHYKISHANLPEAIRIDAISILVGSSKPEIEHAQNISGF